MEIRFQGSLDRGIYEQAVYAARHRRTVILFVMLAAMAMNIIMYFSFHWTDRWILNASLAFVLIGVWMLVAPRFAVRRVWKNSPLLREPFSGVVSESGVRIESKYGSGEVPWGKYYRARLFKEVVLIYRDPSLFYIFHVSYFSDPQRWQQFKELVKAKVRRT